MISAVVILAAGMGAYGMLRTPADAADAVTAGEMGCSSCDARHAAMQRLQPRNAGLPEEESD